MDALDGIVRLQQISLARSGTAAAYINAGDGSALTAIDNGDTSILTRGVTDGKAKLRNSSHGLSP